MKTAITISMLLLLGCGGAEPDEALDPELGVLRQPIISYALGYGNYNPDPTDSTAGFSCPSVMPSANNPNENDYCSVPSDKSLSFYINGLPNDANNAANVNFRARAHSALLDIGSYIGLQVQSGTWGITESFSDAATDAIFFGTCPPNKVGCAGPDTDLTFTHQPGTGWIGKEPRCFIKMVPAQFPAAAGGQNAWNSFSQTQKDRFVKNVIVHELAHCVGLPHVQAGTPGPAAGVANLMLEVMPTVALNQDIALTASQKRVANSYVPSDR
jgi:hypothetical protein